MVPWKTLVLLALPLAAACATRQPADQTCWDGSVVPPRGVCPPRPKQSASGEDSGGEASGGERFVRTEKAAPPVRSVLF
jgi:hypothetical protein